MEQDSYKPLITFLEDIDFPDEFKHLALEKRLGTAIFWLGRESYKFCEDKLVPPPSLDLTTFGIYTIAQLGFVHRVLSGKPDLLHHIEVKRSVLKIAVKIAKTKAWYAKIIIRKCKLNPTDFMFDSQKFGVVQPNDQLVVTDQALAKLIKDSVRSNGCPAIPVFEAIYERIVAVIDE